MPKLFEKADMDKKRELVKLTHSNLQLYNNSLRSELRFPFDEMAKCKQTGNWQESTLRNRTFGEEVGKADIVSIRHLLDGNDQQEARESRTL